MGPVLLLPKDQGATGGQAEVGAVDISPRELGSTRGCNKQLQSMWFKYWPLYPEALTF